MGVAVCEAARDRGARVTLVAGMLAVAIPDGVAVVRAETAAAMEAALRSSTKPLPMPMSHSRSSPLPFSSTRAQAPAYSGLPT